MKLNLKSAFIGLLFVLPLVGTKARAEKFYQKFSLHTRIFDSTRKKTGTIVVANNSVVLVQYDNSSFREIPVGSELDELEYRVQYLEEEFQARLPGLPWWLITNPKLVELFSRGSIHIVTDGSNGVKSFFIERVPQTKSSKSGDIDSLIPIVKTLPRMYFSDGRSSAAFTSHGKFISIRGSSIIEVADVINPGAVYGIIVKAFPIEIAVSSNFIVLFSQNEGLTVYKLDDGNKVNKSASSVVEKMQRRGDLLTNFYFSGASFVMEFKSGSKYIYDAQNLGYSPLSGCNGLTY